MAGAIHASVITSVLKRLSTLITKASSSSSPALPSSAEDELQELEKTMKRIHAVLEDAAEKDISDKSEQLRLLELKEVAYDAEDAVDEYAYEVLRAKVEARRRARATHTGDKYDKVILDLNSYHPKVPISDELASRFKDIRKKFEEITNDWNRITLREKDGKRRCITKWKPTETASFFDRSQTFGREDEKEKIIKWLLQEEELSGHSVSALCIVGMGGLGKTTLAQMSYNDTRVCQHFNFSGWVYVSEDFDVSNVFKKICRSFGIKMDYSSLDELHRELKKILDGKKFFLVLDDVWNQKFVLWSSLKTLLVGVGVGKILITTRNDRVAKIMQTTSPISLSILSPDDSWKLFNKIACEDRDHAFLEIGKKIVDKCKGLPLAIKVLAGLLLMDENEETWVDILESELREIDKEKDDIFPVLRLSYEHLNVELKRCFMYLCLFPKGSFLKRLDIVQQWVSHGFILSQGEKMEEDVGNDYLEEFVCRSILQYDNENFKMHDLIHDLAQSVAKDEHLLMPTLESNQMIPKTIRHLSVNIKGKVEIINLEFLREAKQLRTLILDIDNRIPIVDLLSNLRSLRTLVLPSQNFECLLSFIGSMKHLRYWDIGSHQLIPESAYNLHLLQTLKFSHGGIELSRDIGDLINLRHLIGYNVDPLPHEVLGLTNLQTLPCIHLGIESDYNKWKLKYLKRFSNFRKLSEIRGLETVAWADVTPPEAYLKDKRGMRGLTLHWEDAANVDERLLAQVLDSLQPHRNLTFLEIEHYPGIVLPTWLGHELPALKKLSIEGARRMKSFVVITVEMKGEENVCDGISYSNPLAAAVAAAFPSLEKLRIKNMNELEEWQGEEEDRDFLCLRELHIDGCPKVRKLPFFSGLSTLKINNCPELKTLPSLSGLSTLHINNCPELKTLPSLSGLSTLHINNCPELKTIPSLSRLSTLSIDNCPELKTLLSLYRLSTLRIINCPELKRLPSLPLLTHLFLDQFSSELLFGCSGIPMLHTLSISYSGETLIFPDEGRFTQLEQLTIRNSPELRFVGRLSGIASLQLLDISKCPFLQFSGCPKLWKEINELKTLPSLPSVTKLWLYSNFNLELLHCLPMLRCLHIHLRSCPSADARR